MTTHGKAPTAGEVHSPCPGLNTLANHGYIPCSGKAITITEIMDAAVAGFNVANTSILQAAKFGLLSGLAFDTMDLDALALHNLVEHVTSISRQDWALGDNLHFNETLLRHGEHQPGLGLLHPRDGGADAEDAVGRFNRTEPQCYQHGQGASIAE
ncbi:Chloroperoxidase [Roridomyces roridus]|uniref:Chloroperoxidase n=1 Tax=Roridomyces roridus TaxID=1738132 RepID=A0AAD7AXV0_9AGAR|nr:Chloroperoxidase [Roridomyces roridus]